jgi:hypothetical protein
MGKRVPGNIRYASLHKNRLYLFPNDEQRQVFRKDPDKYADFDLAIDGICSVCRVELKQDILASQKFLHFMTDFATSFHQRTSERCFWPIRPSTQSSRQ